MAQFSTRPAETMNIGQESDAMIACNIDIITWHLHSAKRTTITYLKYILL